MQQALTCLHPSTIANFIDLPVSHNSHSNRLFWRVDADTLIGRFYLLQARPIKGVARAEEEEERQQVRCEEIAALAQLAAPEGTVWARFNLAEILPEPTPMTWAIVRRFMSGQGGFGLRE